MPADTATASLGLLLMGTGNDDNTWGDLVNQQIIQYVEDALVGRIGIATTGGTTVLTQAQTRYKYITVNGTLTSDATLVLPTAQNEWIITNSCVGNFGLLVKTAVSNTTSIPAGTWKHVTSMLYNSSVLRLDFASVGEYFYHAGSSVPPGALECNGASLLRSSFPDLFVAIGTTFGAVDGTHFTLPDAYTAGKFLRSRTASVAAGTAQADSLASHTHTASGTATTSLSGSVDAGGGHTPTLSSSTYSTTFVGSTDAVASHSHTGTTENANADHVHSGTTGVESANHFHDYSGTTHDDSPDHTHTQLYAGLKSTVGSGGGAAGVWNGSDTTPATGGASVRHQHFYSGTSLGASVSHTHAFTTGGVSATHQHDFTTGTSGAHSHGLAAAGAVTTCTAFTMNAVANHQHAVTGVAAATTITGVTVNATGSTETRPTNLSGILCVRL